jgi:hypothetical protein
MTGTFDGGKCGTNFSAQYDYKMPSSILGEKSNPYCNITIAELHKMI